MGPVNLKPELIISFQIDPSNPKEGYPVTPITVAIENQGGTLAGPIKALFGYFPFFYSGAVFFTDFKCPLCKNMEHHSKYKGPGTHGLLFEWSVPSLLPGHSRSFKFNPSPIRNGKNPPVWLSGKYSFVAQAFQVLQKKDRDNSKMILVEVD